MLFLKSKSRECPDNHGVMYHCHIKTSETIAGKVKQTLIATHLTVLPEYRIMPPDEDVP